MKKILSLDEVISTHTTDDLINLYNQQGISFSNKEQILEQVFHDCDPELNQILESELQETNQLPKLSIKIDGVKYNLWGIHHYNGDSSSYLELIHKTITSHNNWLVEQNLHLFLKDKNLLKYEMIDHSVSAVTDDLKGIPHDLFLYGKLFFEYLGSFLGSKRETHENVLKHRVNMMHFPLDFVYSESGVLLNIPFYVAIEYCIKPESVPEMKRSTYMAAFAKHAYPKAKEKNLLVGFSHSSEIKFCLATNSMDPQIEKKAKNDVNLKTDCPNLYQLKLAYHRHKSNFVLNTLMGASLFYLLK